MIPKVYFVSLKVVPSYKPGSDVQSIFHEVFELTIAMNDSHAKEATITILQKHPIQCGQSDNSSSWYSLKDSGEATNGSCNLTFYPTLYHGINKNLLHNVQVSKCPIEIADASKCSSNNFSEHSSLCNIVDFKLRIDATTIEKLLENQYFIKSSNDSKNNLMKDKVNLITTMSISYQAQVYTYLSKWIYLVRNFSTFRIFQI